jgi:putative oxidoreductase
MPAHDDDRLTSDVGGDVRAALRELIDAGDHLPRSREDALTLALEHAHVGVPGSWDRRGPREGRSSVVISQDFLERLGEAHRFNLSAKSSETEGRLMRSGDETMSLLAKIQTIRTAALKILDQQKSLALLLGRLGVGLVFLSTGWGKVHNIAKVTEFFTELHIPAPGFHAVLVGYSELLCGAALVLGVLTRLATVPLIVSMIVAILTAKRGDIHGVLDLVGFEEFTYLVLLVMIAILGPGNWAVDRVLARLTVAPLKMGRAIPAAQ